MTHAHDDEVKIEEYLKVIEERISAPIQTTEVRQSCTASLLLLFAAIDGLAKLIHPNKNADVGERIRTFLNYMGGDYAVNKKEIYDLRNSLVDDAINVESLLSHAEPGSNLHLKKIGSDGLLYVNTGVLYEDLVNALAKFRADLKHDATMTRRAADRLEWKEIADPPEWRNDHSMDASATPPPPIVFIKVKRNH